MSLAIQTRKSLHRSSKVRFLARHPLTANFFCWELRVRWQHVAFPPLLNKPLCSHLHIVSAPSWI